MARVGIGVAAVVAAVAGTAWSAARLQSHACEFEPPSPILAEAPPVAGREPPAPPVAPMRSDVALATCSLRGSLRMDGLAAVLVDGTRHVVQPTEFAVDGLLPGPHAVTAVWSDAATGPGLFVVQLDVELQPGERRDLGALRPAEAPWSWLRVAVFERTPDGTLVPAAAAAGATADATADATAETQVSVAGVPVARIPFGVPVPVRGLVRGGVEVSAAAAKDDVATAELVPGATTELQLVRGRSATLWVDAAWQPGVAGWLEVHAVRLPDAPRDGRWVRRDGVGALGVSIDAQQGPTLVVASQLDRRGRTQAFACREVALRHGDRVRLELQPTVRATGRWPTGGVRLEIALQRWPKHPLWRADVDAEGRFAVDGLPQGVPLCARVGGAAPRPLHVERTREGIVLSTGR